MLPPSSPRPPPGPSHGPPLATALLGVCALAVVGLWTVATQLSTARWTHAGTSMLTVHLLLELVAVVIATMIVTAAWYGHDLAPGHDRGVVIAGFSVVAVCDVVHALTYEGMPPLLGPSSTPRAIFFWLAGRAVELLTFGLLALAPRLRLARAPALAGSLGVALGLVMLGAYAVDAMPTTFVPGVGVTPFKAACEVLLCAGHLVVALVLLQRYRRDGRPELALLATSAFVLGVGELAFTRYVTPSDAENVFGHLYKVIAYGLLFRATFVSHVRAPVEALVVSEARARESEARLRSLGDNLPHCVVYQLVREPDGRIHFGHVGEGSRAVLGIPPAEIVRDPARAYDCIVPEDRPAMRHAEQRSAQTLQLFDQRVRIRHADGSLRWTRICSRPRALPDGRIVWDGVQIDVTDTQRAEDERARLEQQLRESQKLEAIGTLAGGIAHDFNNVLGGILGHLALAREALASGRAADADAGLSQVERAAVRARELVQKILSFSRRRPPQRGCQPVRPVVEESLGLLRATIPAGVRIQVEPMDDAPWAMVDAGELQQVLMNLATNAWQALGGAAGTITIGLRLTRQDLPPGLPQGDYVHLWVRDDGCGMTEATRARIFEPFYTTKVGHGGTGLGLAVVHGIVRSHGGSITVESAPGHGSTFHIHLPAVAAPAVETAAADAPARPPVTPARVMYIDDDEVMGLLAERLLARDGHEVTVYRDPALALEALREARPRYELVVTDFHMPALSGLDVAEAVRRFDPGVPVIVTSGDVSDSLEQDAPRAGVFQLVRKQHTLDDLPRVVADALARRPSA